MKVFPSNISPLYFSLLMIPITLDEVHEFPLIVRCPCSFSSLAIIVLPAPATYLSKMYLNKTLLQTAVGTQPQWYHTILTNRSSLSPEILLSEISIFAQNPRNFAYDPIFSARTFPSISLKYSFVFNIRQLYATMSQSAGHR